MDNLTEPDSDLNRCFFAATISLLVLALAVLMIAVIATSNGLADLYR